MRPDFDKASYPQACVIEGGKVLTLRKREQAMQQLFEDTSKIPVATWEASGDGSRLGLLVGGSSALDDKIAATQKYSDTLLDPFADDVFRTTCLHSLFDCYSDSTQQTDSTHRIMLTPRERLSLSAINVSLPIYDALPCSLHGSRRGHLLTVALSIDPPEPFSENTIPVNPSTRMASRESSACHVQCLQQTEQPCLRRDFLGS